MKNLARYKDILIDVVSKTVFVSNKEIYLRRLEYLLLLFFVEHPRHVLSRLELLEKVWGYKNAFMKTNTVETHIYNLRRKLQKNSAAELVTVPRVGYILQ